VLVLLILLLIAFAGVSSCPGERVEIGRWSEPLPELREWKQKREPRQEQRKSHDSISTPLPGLVCTRPSESLFKIWSPSIVFVIAPLL